MMLRVSSRACRETRDVDPMLVRCFPIVNYAVQTSNQHWVDVPFYGTVDYKLII